MLAVESHRQGYPRLAAFMNNDSNFVVFRAFGRLHARILLHKQDEIIELEQTLMQLDNGEDTAYYLSSRRHDLNTERRGILMKLETKLVEYGKITRS
jgi:hypothetical protein